jgi:orotidine-5'-phosphate decarboxylase
VSDEHGATLSSRDRLIVALDVPSNECALELVDRLDGSVSFYKLGLELFMAGRYFDLLRTLVDRGKRVMVDLKFFDVPETVAAAVRQLNGAGATFCTVHGNTPMLVAAAGAAEDVGVLAVTVLTSLDQTDVEELGFRVSIGDLVVSRTRRAVEAGCAGVVTSALEVPRIRAELSSIPGPRFAVVVPGIRPVLNRRTDDQKRVASAAEAILAGADHVVVGRPIREASDPRAAADAIVAEIEAALH